MNNTINGTGLYTSGLEMLNGTIAVQVDKALQDLRHCHLDTGCDDVQKLRRAIADRDLGTIRLLGHSKKIGRCAKNQRKTLLVICGFSEN